MMGRFQGVCRKSKMCIWFLCAIVIAGIICVMLVMYIPFCWGERKIDYTEGGARCNEKRFGILLFPKGEIIDSRHGQEYALNRAIIVSLEENAQDKVEVWNGKTRVMLDRNLLAPVPPTGWDKYVNALNAEVKRWGSDTDWSHVIFGIDKSDSCRMQLIIWTKKKKWIKYMYEIRNMNMIVPLSETHSL